MSKQDDRMMYKVVVRTSVRSYDEYKVYSHHLDNGCLVMNQGKLNGSLGPDEIGIPISQILDYHTSELD